MISLKNISVKKYKWPLIISLLLIFIGGGTFLYFYEPLTPEELVTQSMDNTLKAQSYRYNAITKSIIDNEEELLTQVDGEKSNDDVHLKGKVFIVNGDLEVYRVNGKLYRKDTFSDNWLELNDIEKEDTGALMQEINPLGMLDFEGKITAQLMGKEKINKIKCKKFKVNANWTNKYLQTLWKDLNYVVWVNPRKKNLVKAKVYAVNKDHNNNSFEMNVIFSDLNDEIKISAPSN